MSVVGRQFSGGRSSLYELETQIVIASELRYLTVEECESLLVDATEQGRIINALMNSLKSPGTMRKL
ncbi:MAG: four helix bundle protein [Candidatus Korobacteraceae bacterium]